MDSVSERAHLPRAREQSCVGKGGFISGQVSKRYPALFVVGVSQAFGLVLMLVIATLTGSWSTPLDYCRGC